MSLNTTELLQAGVQHHRSGRLREAGASYRTVLENHPRNPDALYLMGVLMLQTGDATAALGLIEQAIAASPGNPEYHNMCGEAHRAMGQHETAIKQYQRAIAIDRGNPGVYNNLGNAYRGAGRAEEALECYRRAIAVNPDFAMSHNNMGLALKDLARPEEAVAHYERAIAIAPDYVEAYSNLGNALLELGRVEQAVECHRRAVAIVPDQPEALCNLGNSLRELGRHDAAVGKYEQALRINPGLAMAHYNLGIARDEMGRPEEAIGHYRRALELEPDYAEAHNNLGNALDEMGRQEDAATHYRRAISIRPEYAEAHRNLTRIRPAQAQVRVIGKLLEDPSLPETDAVHCHFALANSFNHAKVFDLAFEHYSRGNALKRRSVTWDADRYSAFVDRLISAYSRGYFMDMSGSGSDAELPVFILGMPRSGTSLVEQIVSSHGAVHGAGELDSFARLEEALARLHRAANPYPECMSTLDPGAVAKYAGRYLDELRGHSQTALRVTDKMPGNFARIGLIKTLFPGARIIHCRRNPLDTCISNYLHYFATGNEFSFDLRELGRYYLDYERLMRHWNGLFPGEIFDVQYEELLVHQEDISRAMIDFMGLDWDERCLEFHRNIRAVHTFSSMQVRQPLYTSSVNRWRYYEAYLAPLIETLRGAVSGLPFHYRPARQRFQPTTHVLHV